MEKTALTVDERMALRMWCRQAMAKLEQEELKERMLKNPGRRRNSCAQSF